MERKTVQVRGKLVDRVPESLYTFMRQNGGEDVERYTGAGFDVIVADQYSFRTNSDLQATLILEDDGTNQLSVTLLAGGGGHGLIRWDWGAESSHIEALVSTLEQVCDQWGLTIESR
jgi:hypothetical protein